MFSFVLYNTLFCITKPNYTKFYSDILHYIDIHNLIRVKYEPVSDTLTC